MKKFGRPKKEETRCRRIGLSLTESELSALKSRAEKAKTTVSDFAYKAVMSKEINVVSTASYEVINDLNILGGKIYQIAQSGLEDENNLKIIVDCLNKIRAMKDKLSV